ncbi:peptide deformylase [Streptococcus danieliae]|uniref:Peptide deformylase n=1 Tax=Streptococcus danieliae TaxID=747656 RepID=A0A7Z0M6H6_9STRE|nr:peptide deformylase [Streptococcus danieliae]MBF0699527.1 peptide deformylase [Streptococcus danieliae]MBF0843932.1 peptide deformylase [Streptococcus danieliae]MCU0081943.1 peptide deformylase [Streptococcus danieliae]NYS96703.1 peptide deformylase [Streptococcus danieliae]
MAPEIIRDQVFLSQPSLPVTPMDIGLADSLRAALAANRERCVGLAANMIGHQKQAMIISLAPGLDLVLFNPTILSQSEPYQTEEGCLSLDGIRPTKRYRKIQITYWDQNFQQQELDLEGFPAQIFQHEWDHFQGILI